MIVLCACNDDVFSRTYVQVCVTANGSRIIDESWCWMTSQITHIDSDRAVIRGIISICIMFREIVGCCLDAQLLSQKLVANIMCVNLVQLIVA